MANLQKLNPTQQELYNYLEQQTGQVNFEVLQPFTCLLYTSPSPRD